MRKHYLCANGTYLVCFDTAFALRQFIQDNKDYLTLDHPSATAFQISLKQLHNARRFHHEYVTLFGKHEPCSDLVFYEPPRLYGWED